MQGDYRNGNSKATIEAIHRWIDEEYAKHTNINVKLEASVSAQQFSALHVYCQKLADLFNASGIDVKMLVNAIKDGVNIWHTKDSIKELVYKPILAAVSNKESTTKQNTVDPGKVQAVIDKFCADRFGIIAPDWPVKKGR